MAQPNKSEISPTARLFQSIRQGKDITTIRALLCGVNLNATDSDGNTPLLLAAIHCEKEIFKLLYECEASVKTRNRDGCNVLHYACRNGWGKIVRSLANHNWVRSKVLHLNDCDRRLNTALHYASISGHLKVVQFLKKKRVNCNQKNSEGFTPLLCAAEESHYDVFNALCNFSLLIIDESDGRLLLYFAVKNNWQNVVPFLFRRVPDLYKTFGMVRMPFNLSCNEHLEFVKLLVEEGTITNVLKKMICRAALYCASCKGHLNVVKWLVKDAPDFRAWDYCGGKPLHAASTNGHLEIVKCLLETGIGVNARQVNGERALHGASMNGHLEIVKCLLERGSYIDAKTLLGRTALHWASMKGHLEVVKCLVEKGANINAKCVGDAEPLLYAANNGHKDVVALLIDSGAHINRSSTTQCYTILLFATENMWLDVVKSLIKRGCEVDVKNCHGGTALKFACRLQQMDIAQALLQAGASWDMEDDNGKSPFNYLFLGGKPVINLVKLFIENGAYFKPADYYAIVQNSLLEVLKDAKLCCQAIINKFNNYDLPALYKLLGSRSLPRITKMKIKSDSKVAQTIEQTVGFDIQTAGHCNILKVRPMPLSVLSVGTILRYYKKIPLVTIIYE